MKNVKKLVLISISLIILFGYVSSQKGRIRASEVLDNDNKRDLFNIRLNIDGDIPIDGVEIERYISTPCYENGRLTNFENTYYDTVTLFDDSLIVERISDNMYMKLKLDTLPVGYGSTNIGYFVSESSKTCEFDILKVETCSVEYTENEQIDIVFKSSDDKRILVDYQLSSTKLSNTEYTISVITSQETFSETIVIDVHDGLNNIFDNFSFYENCADTTIVENVQNSDTNNVVDDEVTLPFVPKYSNYELFQNNESKFIVVYNPSTMDLKYVQRVAYYIELINQFFCVNQNMNLIRPTSVATGEYYIYLYDRGDGSIDDVVSGDRKDSVEGYMLPVGRISENRSYIGLLYELVTTEGGLYREASFSMVLAHEYFHSICHSYTRHLEHWVHEAFATFGGLLFINSIKKGEEYDPHTAQQFFGRFVDYLLHSKLSIDDCSVSDKEYSLFLLPLYIYQEFGISGIKEFLSLHTASKSEFDCFNEMLESRNTNFSDLYVSYVLYNIYPYLGYSEIDPKYKNEWNYYNHYNNVSIEDVYESKKSSKDSYELPYYSNNILRYSAPKKCDEYNVYYTVELSDYAPISIYQVIKYSDNTVDTYKVNAMSNSITIPLSYYDIEKSVDNIAFAIINSDRYSNKVNVNTSITVEHKINSIELDEMVDVGQHLHKQNAVLYLEFIAPETDVYEIKFQAISAYDHLEINGCRANLVKVVDEYKNAIYKYKDENNKIEVGNAILCNNIAMPLEKDKTYYLKFQVSYVCDNFYVNIKKVDTYNEIVDLTNANYTDKELTSGDHVYKIDRTYPGFYRIDLSVQSKFEVSQRDLIFVIFYKKNDEIKIEKSLLVHSNGENNKFGVCMYSNREYYIGMLNCQDEYKYTISSDIRIEDKLSIMTDVNENVSVGSEVYLNNGDYNGRTITEGYTRVIYPFKSYVAQSRLDYDWYSMDESKAIVSKYGTVTAMPIEEEEALVKILLVNKKDPGYAKFIEFKIKKDHSSIIKQVKLTTDVRQGGTASGTEVTENGGAVGDNTIHVGYTRLICFDGKTSPSDNIQDFVWTSSNEKVVTVSQYGTVKVISNPFSPIAGDNIWMNVTITGVYKYNSNFVATIVIRVKK